MDVVGDVASVFDVSVSLTLVDVVVDDVIVYMVVVDVVLDFVVFVVVEV